MKVDLPELNLIDSAYSTREIIDRERPSGFKLYHQE